MNGVKYDGEKLRWSLLPWVQLATVVAVLEYGARKYAFENWKRVERARVRYFDAAMRHLLAWHSGERADAESGLSHLAHAICCLLFLAWFDDQAVAPSSPEEAPAAPAARALPERPAPAADEPAVGRGDDVVGPPPRGFEYLDPKPRGAECLAPAGFCPEPFSQEWAEELILKATPGADAPEPAPEVSTDAMGATWRERLIELGKSKGHLTYGEIVEALPEDSSSDQIEEFVGILGDEGIELVDAPLWVMVTAERAVEEPATAEEPAPVEPPAGPPPVMRPRCRPTPLNLLDSFPAGMAQGSVEGEIRTWVAPYLPDWKAALEQCDRCDYLFWLGSRLLVCGALRRQDFVLAMCACVRTALVCSREGADVPSRALEAAERWARGEVGLDVVKSAASAAAELAKQSLSTGSFYSLCWACAGAADGCDSLFLGGGNAPATPALVAANVLEDCGVSSDMVSIVRRTFVPALVAAIDSYLNATYEGVPDA